MCLFPKSRETWIPQTFFPFFFFFLFTSACWSSSPKFSLPKGNTRNSLTQFLREGVKWEDGWNRWRQTQQIWPTGGTRKSKRRTNLVFSPAEMGKFFYHPVVYLISCFLASSCSLRGKYEQKAMFLWGRKVFAVSRWHLSLPEVPCLPCQPPLPITSGLAVSPGIMTLRAVQKGISHLNFHLPIVGSKYLQCPQAGTTL